jgi:hypothetical protein
MHSRATCFKSHVSLAGSARPNDMIEFPTLATQKKIKGLQMFRRKANIVQQGDRAGICVSNFDAKLMERGASFLSFKSLVYLMYADCPNQSVRNYCLSRNSQVDSRCYSSSTQSSIL